MPMLNNRVGGDVGCGDDRAYPSGAFGQGCPDQEACPGAEGIPEHGPQGGPERGDVFQLRAEGSAAAEAGSVDRGSGRLSGGEREEASPGPAVASMRMYEELAALGYAGGYDAVRRYAGVWRRERRALPASQAFVPLSFAPGEAYQFDWSHEYAVLSGVTTRVKASPSRAPASGSGARAPAGSCRPAQCFRQSFPGFLHDNWRNIVLLCRSFL